MPLTPDPQPNPSAAVLIIGDEILSGRTLDTNVGTLARFLSPLGIDLCEVRMVPDEEGRIITALNALRTAYDYVFTTGGIGPTHDDITAPTVAKAFGVALEMHSEAMHRIEVRAAMMGYALNDNARLMARIPQGASLIDNPISAAPGFHIDNVFVMAGVPKIMAAMLNDVEPRLRKGHVVHSRTLKLSEIGESWAADVLKALDDAYDDLSFGSYPFGPNAEGIFGTHLVIRGKDNARLDQALAELKLALVPVLTTARALRPNAYFEDNSQEVP